MLLKVLAGLRGLRGGFFDPFAWQADRKFDRRLIAEFEQKITAILSDLHADNLSIATELVLSTQSIRGFGHVRLNHYAQAQAREVRLWQQFRGSQKR